MFQLTPYGQIKFMHSTGQNITSQVVMSTLVLALESIITLDVHQDIFGHRLHIPSM